MVRQCRNLIYGLLNKRSCIGTMFWCFQNPYNGHSGNLSIAIAVPYSAEIEYCTSIAISLNTKSFNLRYRLICACLSEECRTTTECYYIYKESAHIRFYSKISFKTFAKR